MACQPTRWYLCTILTRLLQSVCASGGRQVVLSFLASGYLPADVPALLEHAIERASSIRTGMTPRELDNDMKSMIYIFRFVTTYQSEPDGVSIAYFYAEHCDQMLELLTRTGHLLDRVKDEYGPYICANAGVFAELLTHVAVTGGTIHSKLQKPPNTSLYHPSIIAESTHIEQNRLMGHPMASPWIVADYLSHFLARERCGRPDCQQTFASTGSKFLYCAGCRRTPYCSMECQRGDVSALLFYLNMSLLNSQKQWKDSRRPHKAICKDLALLGAKLNYPTMGVSYNHTISAEQLQDICIAEGVSVDVVKRLYTAFTREQDIMKETYTGKSFFAV